MEGRGEACDGLGVVGVVDFLADGSVGRHIAGAYIHSGNYFDLQSDWDQAWLRVFDAVGLDLTVPTSALTELTTSAIARDHDLSGIRRSCLLGTLEGPCDSCEKCLRKSLIESFLDQEDPDWEVIENCSREERVASKLQDVESIPQKHLYAYLFARIPELRDTFLAYAYDLLIEPPEATQWVERYYPRGVDEFVPERWRPQTRENLERWVEPMTEEQVRQVENWPESLTRVPNQAS